MSKLHLVNRIPRNYDPQTFTDILRQIETQVNNLSEGKLAAEYQAQTSYPTGTAQSYAVGDIVRNINPSEAGATAGMYVVVGWICTTAGSPGTWKEMRCLTGN